MNKKIKEVVDTLNDIDTFRIELAKATGRKTTSITSHWLKKDGFKIPKKYGFQETALKIALKLKAKQEKQINNLNVKL